MPGPVVYIRFDGTIGCTAAFTIPCMTIRLIYTVVQMLHRSQGIVVTTDTLRLAKVSESGMHVVATELHMHAIRFLSQVAFRASTVIH